MRVWEIACTRQHYVEVIHTEWVTVRTIGLIRIDDGRGV